MAQCASSYLVLLFLSSVVHSNGFKYNDNYQSKWDAFTGAILTFINNSTDGNYTCSPFAAAMATRMLARGFPKHNFYNPIIQSYFDVTSRDERSGDQYNINQLSPKNVTTVKVKLLNKIFVKDNLIINPNYASLIQNDYNSKIESIDFSNVDEAVGKINYQYTMATKERIERMVSKDDIGNDTDILVVSVLDFEAKWENNFRLYDYIDFHVDGTWFKRCKLMKMIVYAVYDELPNDPKCKFVKLPYRGQYGPDDDTYMVIVIPDDHRGHKTFNISSLTANDFRSQRVKRLLLKIPSFKIETKVDVKDVLNGINIPTFSDSNLDYSGIATKRNMNVKFIQKSTIHFHNEGTNTRLQNVISKYPDGPYVEAYNRDVLIDHPFFVLIIKNDIILQVARIIDPISQFYETEWQY